MRILTFEEHFTCPEATEGYLEYIGWPNVSPLQKAKMDRSLSLDRVPEVGQRRIEWMDENNVSVQVLSYGDFTPSDLPKELSVDLCRKANDYLAQHCAAYPDRLHGFATLPVDDPEAAVEELDRAVTELGLKGVGLKATYAGKEFWDSPRFAPIFDEIARLSIPFTIHPNEIVPAVSQSYYEGEGLPLKASAALSSFGIGWHYEAGVSVLRLVASGLFDRHPNLQMLLGHWGENVVMYLGRLDGVFAFACKGLLQKKVSDYFTQNMYVMPSGMFDTEGVAGLATRACLEVWGADRVLWSNDYPYYESPDKATTDELIARLNVPEADKEKIAHLNGERLLGL